MKTRHVILLSGLALILPAWHGEALTVKDLPPAEQQVADAVDPWGLAFADQYARFQSYFEKSPAAGFVVGYTHNLDKIFPNKYWFRGEIVRPGETADMKPLWTARNATVSFQIAVLPKTGREKGVYTLSVEAPITPVIYREEFVKVGYPPYPSFHSEYWPDPLVKENSCEISGLNCAVFLVEITVPAGYKARSLTCTVRVTDRDRQETVAFQVPVRIAPLDLQPKKYPLMAWFNQSTLTDTQFQAMCGLALDHHMQPLVQIYLAALWKKGG